MIWSDGKLPEDAPPFSATLTEDLLDFAYALLSSALTLRRAGAERAIVRRAFEAAAESIESILKGGDSRRSDRGYLSVICAASYQLAGYSARAFIMARAEFHNLSPAERVFIALVLRRFAEARREARGILAQLYREDRQHLLSDEPDEVIFAKALTLNYCRAVASLLAFFISGTSTDIESARQRLDEGVDSAAAFGFVESWWLNKLTRLMVDDFGDESYHAVLPIPVNPSLSALRARFIRALAMRRTAEVDLWPSQLDAAYHAFDKTVNMVVALPTSAGKTRIAEIAMLPALADAQDVIYVTPLRALSTQIERTLRTTFGSLGFSVSSSYESLALSISDLGSASVTVLTPEKLDFALRKNPEFLDNVGLVIFDEGHLIGAEPRELRYELLVDRLLRSRGSHDLRFICLSALLPEGEQFADFVDWFGGATPIRSAWRPTRHVYGQILWHADHVRIELDVANVSPYIDKFLVQSPPISGTRRRNPAPAAGDDWEMSLLCARKLAERGESVLIYCPQKRSVNKGADTAMRLLRQKLIAPLTEPGALSSDEVQTLAEWLGPKHPITICLLNGIAIHHADLPQRVLSVVDRLIRDRVAHIVIASPTVSQGLNISASTVIFHSIHHNRTGREIELIPAEEFLNVVGRAGRAFVDVEGRILYNTGMDAATATWKVQEWNRLRKESSHRALMSGLFQLIMRLLKDIVRQRKSLTDEDIEFIAGNAGFDAAVSNFDTDGLALLDDAILSIVRDEEIEESRAAEYLDQVLNGTLFAKALKHQSELAADKVTRYLTSRTRSLLARYTPDQRRAAYLSGINVRYSEAFGSLLVDVGELIRDVEQERERGSTVAESRTQLLIKIAEAILAFPTFRPKKFPANWEGIMGAWLSGKPFADILEANSDNMKAFKELVQDRLLWGVEAVRANLVLPPTDMAVSSYFASGLPSKSSILLMRHGLQSRSLAARLGALMDDDDAFDGVNVIQWLDKEELHLEDVLSASEMEAVRGLLHYELLESGRVEYPAVLTMTTRISSITGVAVLVFPDKSSGWDVTTYDLEPLGQCLSVALPRGVELMSGWLVDDTIKID